MLRNGIDESFGSSVSSFLRNIQTASHGAFTKHLERANWPASWETYVQIREQQLELNMEQQTGSK